MTATEIEARFQALELSVNNLLNLMQHAATPKMLRQLTLVRQQEIDALKVRVDALESQLILIQANLAAIIGS